MTVTLTPIAGIPMVRPGDDLAALIVAACERGALVPREGDVVVVAQKIVSKAEGRYVDLAEVRASPRAETLAARVHAAMQLSTMTRLRKAGGTARPADAPWPSAHPP